MKKKKNLLVIAGVVLVVLIFVLSYKPSNRVTPSPNGQPYTTTTTNTGTSSNTWNGITPGVSKLPTDNSALGKELGETVYNNSLIKHTYNYTGGPLQVTVVTDSNNKVVYVEAPDFQTNKGAMDTFISKNNLGNPDFETYIKGAFQFEKAYVFLSKGVALEGNSGIRDLHKVIFFEPTTREQFLSEFGDELTLDIPQTSQY